MQVLLTNVRVLDAGAYGESIRREDGSAIRYVDLYNGEARSARDAMVRATLGAEVGQVPAFGTVCDVVCEMREQDGRVKYRVDQLREAKPAKLAAAS